MPQMHVFNGFGCTGENISPALKWENPPAGTKSFAVTVYDPDAPTGSGWWHWQVFNIPATQTALAQGIGWDSTAKADKTGTAPHIRQGRNDYGAHAYGGPCPPAGAPPHRYIFTVHALKVPALDVPIDASAALIGFMVGANTIEKASFTAFYGRGN